MYLNIRTDSEDLAECFGITEERRLEISKAMTTIFQHNRKNLKLATFYKKLAVCLNTNEELLYCAVTHSMFLAKNNFI